MMQDKRKIIYQAYETKQFVIECTETITWIKEKAKLIQDTEALGNDLTAVIALQRRLAGMERDLSAIEGKIRGLTDEADRLCAEVRQFSNEKEAAALKLRFLKHIGELQPLNYLVFHWKLLLLRCSLIFLLLLGFNVLFRPLHEVGKN